MAVLTFLALFVAPSALAGLPADVDPEVTQNVGVREDAVATLARQPDATQTLIRVLHDDPSEDVRARAAKGLFDRWADADDRDDDLRTYRQVAVWAAENADDPVRAAAVRALGDTGDDYELVTPYLDDDSAAVRAAAFGACQRWVQRHPDRADEVMPLLVASEPTVEDKARRLIEKVRVTATSIKLP